jgi:hypothetical protein
MQMTEAPDRWRTRAQDVRSLANDMQDAETKQIMLRIAREYDDLATLRAASRELTGDARKGGLAARVKDI